MKITYIRLENTAGIFVGQSRKILEIDFLKSQNSIISIQGGNGSGKALPNSTLIPTPNGVKRMGDLKIGDYVFDRTGLPTKILGVYPQGKKDVWEVEFAYGKKAKCCEDHLWRYRYESHNIWRDQITTLKELMNNHCRPDGSLRPIKIPNNGLVEYMGASVPVDPYTLGVFIGNGCCTEMGLTLSSMNNEIPNKIANIHNFIVEKVHDNNHSYIFRQQNGKRIHTKDFFRGVPELVNCYSGNKSIPIEYIHNSKEVRWALLRGLIDTDGSINVDKNRPEKVSIRYSSTSYQLLLDIQYLVRSLGLNATISSDKRVDKYRSGYCGEIRIIGDPYMYIDKICSVSYKYKKLFDIIYSNEFKNKAGNKTNYDWNFIRSINKLDYQEEMTCIMVDNGEHLFLTENFIVTHNTSLLSSLTPFASPTSLDERSSISYIIPGKSGYKEIHYVDNDKNIIIKHYFKPLSSKPNPNGGEPIHTGHSVKSYFQLNNEELNENGNVTSFLALVEIHMGITPEMMRLIRLGTNVNSFITLKPADRKNYIGRLIEEINLYLKVYKKVNDDLRILKVLISTNANNLHNCHISDIILEKDKLSDIEKQLISYEKEKNQVQLKIDKINLLESENNISDLLYKRKEIESSLYEFNKTENEITEKSLMHTSIDDLIKRRSDIIDTKINTRSNINAMRLNIDTSLTRIDQLNVIVKKTISNNDIESLLSLIDDLRDRIKNTDKSIINFIRPDCSSEDVYEIINKLSSFNQIGSMMYTFGNKPLALYLKLRRDNKQIDSFVKEQIKRNLSTINDNELKKLIAQAFQNDMIITPNCDTQFQECPYYRFSEMINDYRNKIDDEVYDEETIRYLKIIANNIDTILNEIDLLLKIHVPEGFKDIMYERSILNRLDNKLPLFDLSDLRDYLSILKSYELYKSDIDKLNQYEAQLAIYKSSGIDSQLSEIKILEESVSKYKSNIITLESDLLKIEHGLENIEYNIGLLTKFNDSKKYKSVMETNLNSINKILIPLEQSENEKVELNYQLKNYINIINSLKADAKSLENRINEYDRLIKESEKLKDKYNKLSVISESVSTRKGIPIIYMNTYLTIIQKLTNDLLSIIYDEDLYIDNFNISADTFEVPYIKNGTVIPDIRYASQSETALMTMALSFALAFNATGKYNILLLDEIDSGLDEDNRSAFLKMLHSQMEKLHSEQVFLISQNASQIVNLPMDVIKLSDVNISGKLQNVIYTA